MLIAEGLELRGIVDKTSWARGEWDSEPDKVIWYDETKFPCLILRGIVGSLNGYVGVPVYYPAYGLSYDGETKHDHDEYFKAFREQVRKRDRSKSILEAVDFNSLPSKPVVPGIGDKLLNIRVHGGLTFAGPSLVITKEMWEHDKKSIDWNQKQAVGYPYGDSAEWLKEWLPVINNYKTWSDKRKATSICLHSEEPDETWWFGFDCAHTWDRRPKIEALSSSLGLHYPKHTDPELEIGYKNIEFVENECRSLAKQLKELE